MLSFDEALHEYRFMGQVVPSVTTVLKPLVDFGGIPAQVLALKADLGTRVHTACEFWDDDDLDDASLDADVRPYLDAWVKFKRDTGSVVLLNEQRVMEPMLGFAGTLDRVMTVQGRKTLLDIKTGAQISAAAGPQTAAYFRALGDMSVQDRAIVRLRPDGTYRFDLMTGANDWSLFLACLAIHKHKESFK